MQRNHLVRWTVLSFCSLTSNEDLENLVIRNSEIVEFWFSSLAESLPCARLARQRRFYSVLSSPLEHSSCCSISDDNEFVLVTHDTNEEEKCRKGTSQQKARKILYIVKKANNVRMPTSLPLLFLFEISLHASASSFHYFFDREEFFRC